MMKIIFYDGSTLTCYEIEIGSDGNTIIADGYRIIKLLEVLRIVAI